MTTTSTMVRTVICLGSEDDSTTADAFRAEAARRTAAGFGVGFPAGFAAPLPAGFPPDFPAGFPPDFPAGLLPDLPVPVGFPAARAACSVVVAAPRVPVRARGAEGRRAVTKPWSLNDAGNRRSVLP
ncbi:MAG: hypothetical protein JJE50_07880 [Actinomycetales bacterium]|nr:hypothetical protein [Actinomycetales bacterium]